MFEKWLTAVASTILILTYVLTTQGALLQQVNMRNLERYDKSGPYTVGLALSAEERSAIEANVRAFLWDHWRRCRLARVEITHYSKEGEPSTSSFFVEPDNGGVWRVAVKIDRTLVDRSGSKRRSHASVEYEAFSVERIEVPKDGLSQRTTIPEAEERLPDSYRLALKDKKGRLLIEI